MEHTHLCTEGRLVAHSARNTAEECRHLGTRLGEAEDVVDEQEHVLVLLIAEVLCDGERRECNPSARARRLVHLTVDQGHAATLGVDDGKALV